MESAAPLGSPVDAQPARPLPPPPPPPLPTDDPDWPGNPRQEQPKLAGQLTASWRMVFAVGWATVIACLAAVWESSRVIGLSTWWLGSDAQPRLVLFQLLPFYGPILVTVGAISNWRYVPYLGIVVAAAGAAIGLGDLGRVRWIAVVELVLAGAAACISVASLAGMYRTVDTTDSLS